ncbi:MAG: AtpZ/AtpI family protein [bacterium]
MKSYHKFDNNFELQDISIKKVNNRDNKNYNQRRFLSVFSLNIGVYLITPLLLGVFLGYNIDKYLNKKPLFTMIFIIIGTLSSFYNLVKLTKEN